MLQDSLVQILSEDERDRLKAVVSQLLSYSPVQVGGTFKTTFADGGDGESGSWWFHSLEQWAVVFDGGPSLVSDGDYSLVTGDGGLGERMPHRIGFPARPPWSLACPRYSVFLGREQDDWFPEGVNLADTLVAVRSTEDARYTGELEVGKELPVLTRVTTENFEQTLEIDQASASVARALLVDLMRAAKD